MCDVLWLFHVFMDKYIWNGCGDIKYRRCCSDTILDRWYKYGSET